MFELAVILSCLAVNAILAGAETAFIAVSRPYLAHLARKNDDRAKQLLLLRENPERALSVIQIGITFVGALAAGFGGAGAEEALAPWIVSRFGINESMAEFLAILVIVIPLTFISVVAGELVPKTLVLKSPIYFAKIAAPWLHSFCRGLDPLVTLFEVMTKKMVSWFPEVHSNHEEILPGEARAEPDVLSPRRQYVINLMKIESTKVEAIIVPWSEVVFVEKQASLEQVEEIVVNSGHTRLPVVEGKEVIGIINTKEFLAFHKLGRKDWNVIIRSPLKIASTCLILTALQLMQENKAHMAIVYDEFVKQGIVTMESIFEEIIGDIYDEDDDGEIKKILQAIHFKKR